jgi:hypothetical protein
VSRFAWREYVTARLRRPRMAAFIDACHDAVDSSVARIEIASNGYFWTTCADDQLGALCADASLPTYSGEDPGAARKRMAKRGQILSAIGTLKGVALIASTYFPQSTRILAVSRPGFYAEWTTAGTETGKLQFSFDWDSATYPGGTRPDRANDSFLIIESPFGFTFRTDTVLQPASLVLQPGAFVSVVGGQPYSVVSALSAALTAHTQVVTTIRECVFVDPLLPSRSYFDPHNELATMPIGQFGAMAARPSVHRYAGELT